MSEFTLYELTDMYRNLKDLDLTDEELQQSLNNIEDEIEIKAENIAKVIKENNGYIDLLKEEEKRLADKRKAIENRQNYLKDYIETSMIATDKRKFKTNLFSFNIQKNPASVKWEDETKIPVEFIKTETKVMKKELKEAVQNGLEIEGVELVSTESLRIR
ncbi:siphovirus Gp157 family protein [Peptoniphilus sp. MSJ-1]|uniref:Siphovirus Gp157 family protein n=1 Tax=Peptoniphilus ovalis TaxID=2841503 RepID=A0ABS6FJY0_9FIRM|nr:siphovirus Gp157 family protein [Peptoniphilus ovalis]MBU5669571.1 siphovirus Gp157 family protein [Peptoniphilus ovalis]